MKVKDLIEYLQECPEDYEVCLSAYQAITEEDFEEIRSDDNDEPFDGPYSVCLDIPIWGIAQNDRIKEVRFILGKSSIESVAAMEDKLTEADAIGNKKRKLS